MSIYKGENFLTSHTLLVLTFAPLHRQGGLTSSLSVSSPTLLCSQHSLISLPSPIHQPRSFSVRVSLSCSLLSLSSLHCWNNHQLPSSLLSLSQSPSIIPAHPAECFLLVGCGPPNPVPVSHTAPASWAEADSLMSKSIIIFSQCNPTPEDIPQRAHILLFMLTVS